MQLPHRLIVITPTEQTDEYGPAAPRRTVWGLLQPAASAEAAQPGRAPVTTSWRLFTREAIRARERVEYDGRTYLVVGEPAHWTPRPGHSHYETTLAHLQAWLPHAITVRPYLGTGPYGDTYGDPVVIRRTYVEDRRRLVPSTDGDELISETTVHTGPDEHIPVRSLVTIWAATPRERTGRVITSTLYDHPATWSHLEVALT
jgi:hypothetical protein